MSTISGGESHGPTLDDKLKQTIAVTLSLIIVAAMPGDLLVRLMQAYGGILLGLLAIALPLGIYSLTTGVKPRGIQGIALFITGALLLALVGYLKLSSVLSWADQLFYFLASLMMAIGLVIAIAFGGWGDGAAGAHGAHGKEGHEKEGEEEKEEDEEKHELDELRELEKEVKKEAKDFKESIKAFLAFSDTFKRLYGAIPGNPLPATWPPAGNMAYVNLKRSHDILFGDHHAVPPTHGIFDHISENLSKLVTHPKRFKLGKVHNRMFDRWIRNNFMVPVSEADDEINLLNANPVGAPPQGWGLGL